MMYRGIQFRGWDKTNKKWVEIGFPFLKVNATDTEKMFFAVVSTSEFEIVKCTNVLASDGKKIWEGDIVRRLCFSENCAPFHSGIVEYAPDLGGYSIVNHETKESVPLVMFYNNLQIGIDRLGNSYEQPDMVKTLDKVVDELSTPQ